MTDRTPHSVRLCSLTHGELAWLFLEPDTGLNHCPRILPSCFRARTSDLAFEERVAQLGVELGHDVERGAAVARANPAGVGEHSVLHEWQLAPRQLVGELYILFNLIVADFIQKFIVFSKVFSQMQINC